MTNLHRLFGMNKVMIILLCSFCFGTAVRSATLFQDNFEPPATQIFFDNFETDQGWTLEAGGEWQRGTPIEGTTSGTKALATDLTGNYNNNLVTTYYATSPVINCASYTRVYIRFKRRLGVESFIYDKVYIEASSDGGASWTRVWGNKRNGTTNDGAYITFILDVSQRAAGNSNFRLRFGIGPTDATVTYTGWNIDDFEVLGQTDRQSWTYSANYPTSGWGIGISSDGQTSGSCAMATFLDENYPNNMTTSYYATSPIISNVALDTMSFQRRLGVESSTYDHVYIQVWNGSSWVTLWSNPTSTINEVSYGLQSYDVSSYANPNFRVRFGIGPTDASITYTGWNIDDFKITGTPFLLSVLVSDSTFTFGTNPLNTWLTPQTSIITNDGTVAENFVGRISQFTDGANTWGISSSANGADTIRAQWSTTSATGPWNDISAYNTDFTIATNVAVNDSVNFWFRTQTPTTTSSYNEHSSTLTVTAQQY